MKRLLFLVLILLVLAAPALAGSQYYIDPSSSFTISGSSGSPLPFEWLTQATSNAQAIFCFVNGSTVTVSVVIGTPNSSSIWSGAYSSATFTPGGATPTPAANGSDSYTSVQAQNSATPWASGVHACATITGSQPGNAFLIRAQTVCCKGLGTEGSGDSFSITAYGTALDTGPTYPHMFTLSSYVANTGDGTLNPRVYAATCIPAGSSWSLTTGLSNTYQASLSSSLLYGSSGWTSSGAPNGAQGIWYDDWYHCSVYPGTPASWSAPGTYGGTLLEVSASNPSKVHWYYPSGVWSSTSNGLKNGSTFTIANGGSGYPALSTFNVQVITGTGSNAQSSGMLSVTTDNSGGATGKVVTINGVTQGGNSGYVKGCGYPTGTLATYTNNGGSGFTVTLASGNLSSATNTDFEAMVDQYPKTWWWDGIHVYIHNPYGANNPTTAGAGTLWITNYGIPVGCGVVSTPNFININGVDGYYGNTALGSSDAVQAHFMSNSIIQNCTAAFAVYQSLNMTGYNNQYINDAACFGCYANACPFEQNTNSGYQTDLVHITNCSDWCPVNTAQFGVTMGGLFGDFTRDAAFGMTWPTSPSGGFTFSTAIPAGSGSGSTASTLYNVSCSGNASMTTTSSVTTVSGNTYRMLWNLKLASGVNPQLTMTGATLTGSPVTLQNGWNTITFTATGSSATFTLATTGAGASSFNLTPRVSHQMIVNGYSLNNPNGATTLPGQDYYNAAFIQYSSNSTFANMLLNGQTESAIISDTYNLNPLYDNITHNTLINGGSLIVSNGDDGITVRRSQLFAKSSVGTTCVSFTPPTTLYSAYLPYSVLNNVLSCPTNGGSTGVRVFGSSYTQQTNVNCNTFYNCYNHISLYTDSAGGTNILDNIFEGGTNVITSNTTTVTNLYSNYNNAHGITRYGYYNSTAYNAVSAWHTQTGLDNNTGTSSSNMVNPGTSPSTSNNFRLNRGSPCINAGTAPPAGAPTQDALYTNYTSGFWDQGAYQFKRGLGF